MSRHRRTPTPAATSEERPKKEATGYGPVAFPTSDVLVDHRQDVVLGHDEVFFAVNGDFVPA